MYKDKVYMNLSEGDVWKILMKFTIPIFLGIIFQSLYTTIDAIIIGRAAGKIALAAIESVATMLKIPINFFIGVSSAGTIIVSKFFGAKLFDDVRKSCHDAMMFSILGGMLISLIALLISPFLIKAINVPVEIINDAQRYVLIYSAAMIFMMIYNMGAGILRALGNSKIPFYILVSANLINIVLDLLFVAVFKLGVTGAATATAFSQFMSAFLVVGYMIKKDIISFRELKFYKTYTFEIIKIGLPIGIQSALFPVSNMIVQSHINILGVNYIAGWSVCGKMDFLIWYISEAFGTSISIFTAQNYGAGIKDRIGKGVKAGLVYSVSSVGLVSLILYIFNIPLAGLFVKDTTVIGLASEMMMFIAPFYFLYAICEIFPGAIKGTGETFRPMIVTLVFTCLSRIIWVSVLPADHCTFKMVLFCYPLSWLLTAMAFTIYYFIYFRKLKRTD